MTDFGEIPEFSRDLKKIHKSKQENENRERILKYFA